MCQHPDIRPVERDCICPQRDGDGPHVADCNAQFRAKFFGTVHGVRAALRASRGLPDPFGAAPTLN